MLQVAHCLLSNVWQPVATVMVGECDGVATGATVMVGEHDSNTSILYNKIVFWYEIHLLFGFMNSYLRTYTVNVMVMHDEQ